MYIFLEGTVKKVEAVLSFLVEDGNGDGDWYPLAQLLSSRPLKWPCTDPPLRVGRRPPLDTVDQCFFLIFCYLYISLPKLCNNCFKSTRHVLKNYHIKIAYVVSA